MTLPKSLPWLVATLAVAGLVHVATLYAVPRAIMMRVIEKMGAPNTMHFAKRPDASSRGVVRPSADLLYSACAYDLSSGPLLVTAPAPRGLYWSVSAYDADTDNYFVRNDRRQHGPLHLTIYAPDPATGHAIGSGAAGGDAVVSPTRRGIVLFRTVVDSDASLPALDAERRQTHCAIVH